MAHGHATPQPLPLPGVSKIIAIGSGKGGVGKTTVAVNLAIALSKLGQRVGLIDADIYGPNVPLMMGSTQSPRVGAGQPDSAQRHAWHQDHLHRLYLARRQATGHARTHAPPDHPPVPAAGEWGQLDYLIVDLPPGTGDVVISLVQTVPLTGAVVVVHAERR